MTEFSLNRNVPLKPSGLFLPTQKLVGERHGINAVDHELALADHVHRLNADEYSPSGPARFEVEYRPGHPLDGAIILLDEVLKLL